MRYVGYSELYHDAGIGIIDQEGNIEFASQSERYSGKKNDPILHYLLKDMVRDDDIITYYEDPYVRDKTDAMTAFLGSSIDHQRMRQMSNMGDPKQYNHCLHHISHAAGALATRPWEDASDTVILTIDGVGEHQSATIMDSKFNLLHEEVYPQSIGIIYSNITKIMNLKPNEEEYIVMGQSAYGVDTCSEELYELYKQGYKDARDLTDSISYIFRQTRTNRASYRATSVQKFAEKAILELAKKARQYGSKLVYSGGVAQNILANTLIRDMFDDVWIAVAPTDGGSGLGAAAYQYYLDTGKDKINWQNAYLGFEMGVEWPDPINPKHVVDHLLEHKFCGVASGKAEFGPRALGNRSLIADVRYDVKDTVNTIKRRQKFRPFAPAILEEYADQYFEGHMNEYMQYTAKAKHDYTSVTHVDGTARVQIVKKDNPSILRKILEEYYERTGVPMLLNTSLNIRGMPIVNNKYQAYAFEIQYGVKVFSDDSY